MKDFESNVQGQTTRLAHFIEWKKKTSIDWAAEVYCEGGKGLSLCGFPLALMSLCFTCKSDWLCIIHFELRCSLLINPGCRGKASAVCFYALAFSLVRLQGYPVLHFMLDQSCSVKKINSLNKNQGVHNWSVKAMQCLSIQNLFIFPQNPLNIFPPCTNWNCFTVVLHLLLLFIDGIKKTSSLLKHYISSEKPKSPV